MLTRLVLFVALIGPLSGIISSDDGYGFTIAEARAAVREYYRYESEEEKSKPRLPYRETFEKAMRGDVKAQRVLGRHCLAASSRRGRQAFCSLSGDARPEEAARDFRHHLSLRLLLPTHT